MVVATGEQLETIQGALRFVQGMGEPEAGELARQLERAALVEGAMRKVIAETEYYFTLVMQPTYHRREYDSLQRAIAEGKARLRG